MSTTLHTFMEIFNLDIEGSEESLRIQKISIPIIQRDYAQGRRNPDVDRVRSRFLDSLHSAFTDQPLTLDFVYGDVDANGTMTPLDGQQRLTTLFLLHWYAAKKENIESSKYEFLRNFSYETRYSARQFCAELVDFEPFFEGPLSSEIIEQAWFPLEWKKDPTIGSMLVVLDDIADKFADIDNIWEKLKQGAITFYFLPIKDMGLTDELYIKMNSRGKPLTQFEHFKAELERNLKEINPDIAKSIMSKIDIDWTDILWMYRGDDNVIDDEFLRYFKFICDIICYRENGTPQGRSYDEFFLLNEYFSKNAKNVEEHITVLESFFDCWCKLGQEDSPKSFAEKYISNNHEVGKIQVRGETDLFEDCLRNYALSYGRNRKFPLGRIVLLYSIVLFLINKDEVTNEQFKRRIRIINNLVKNSEYEVSDSETRQGGNRMPAILKQVDSIMLNGIIDEILEPNFNAYQIAEEIQKNEWLENNGDLSDALYKLEDHSLLYGQIGIVGLENINLATRFESLFECDLGLVDSALMSLGNYSQCERNGWRCQFGTSNERVQSAWQTLFHKSANYGYQRTKDALLKLLCKSEKFSNEILKQIIEEYILECEANHTFDISYYYVKYDSFRPCSYGKCCWEDMDKKPYEIVIMRTGQYMSQSSYQPFLYEVDNSDVLSRDDYGRSIQLKDKYIICQNDAYVVKSLEDDSEMDRLVINQHNGIDIEDRIIKFRSYYENNKD